MQNWIVTRGGALALMLAAGAVCAQEEPTVEDTEGWYGSGELGAVVTSGNTDTQTVNAKFALGYAEGSWEHTAAITALTASEGDEATAERYELAAKTKYLTSDISYWFGALRYENDRFSGFDYQATLTGGYGRTLFASETQQLDAEIGAGVRRSQPVDEPDASSDPIARGALLYWWEISDTTRLENNFLVEAGSDNTYLEDTIALAVDINDHLAVKLGYSVRHNTDVAPAIENTDTVATVNLVYSFQ